jgi:hypothetical protein
MLCLVAESNEARYGARLSILPWYFNVIKLSVLKFSEIVAEEV